jgi:glutathione S-transferase
VADPLTLVSHALCPYVQRAAIVLLEKGVPFDRRWVDLSAKPQWFTKASPLGRTPVLLVGTQPVFESAVICEYLDETLEPRLHPIDPLARASHRGWMEVGSSLLATVAGYYNAPDTTALKAHRQALIERFARVEGAVDGDGPWFAGSAFSVVDAVFAPLFRYFDAFEAAGERAWFDATPRLRRWRRALAARPSVVDAILPDYPDRLQRFLVARNGELARRIAADAQSRPGLALP